MARLARVHMAGIGTEAARFSPLTLDFRDKGKKVNDAVIWLRNGGGKTCWLSLFYSVFCPRAQHFLLKKAKTKEASIADFVRSNDLAFIITEWEEFVPQADGELITTDRVRIVGRVLSWKGLQRSSDRANLQNLFFSFRCSEKVGLRNLPVLGLGSQPSKSFDDFKDWLQELARQNSHLEVAVVQAITEWETHLEKIGFDPAIFGFQVLMNQREGDIDQYFKDFCSSSIKFTREFLKLAHQSQAADLLSKNLIAMKERLARREPLRNEQAFISAFLAELNPFRLESENYLSLKQTQSKLQKEARGMQVALEENLKSLRERLESEQELKASALAAKSSAQETLTRLKGELAYLEIREAEILKAEAQAALSRAKAVAEEKKQMLAVAKAAVEFAELRKHEAAGSALKTALDAELQKNKPVLDELRRLGSIYREVLTLQRSNQQAEKDVAVKRAQECRSKLAELTRQEQQATQEKHKLELQLDQVEGKIRERDNLLRAYRENGLVLQDEVPASALERHKGSLSKVKSHIAEFTAKRVELRKANEILTTEKEKALQEKGDIVNQISSKNETITRAQQQEARLSQNSILLELTNGQKPQLENVALHDGLKDRLNAQQRLVLAAEVDDAEDRRALSHLDACGLLPPSRDVEALLAELKKRDIPSFSAFSYLADNVTDSAKALEIILSDPAKFSGVLVNTEQILGRIDQNIAASLKGPVEVAISSMEPGLMDTDRIVLPPATAGAFNKSAAAAEKELIQTRSQKRKLAQEEAALHIAAIQNLQRELSTFIAEFGSGKLAVLTTQRDRLEEAKTVLETRIAEKENQRKANNVEISDLDGQIDSLQKSLEPLQNDINVLVRFLNEHESEYLKNRQVAESVSTQITSVSDRIQSIQQQIPGWEAEERTANEKVLNWSVQLSNTGTELSQIAYASEDRAAAPFPELEFAKAAYGAQLSVYNQVSTSNLEGQLQRVQQDVASHRNRFDRAAKGLEKAKIVEFANAGSTELRRDEADQDFHRSSAEQTAAESAHNYLQSNLTKVQGSNKSRARIPEGKTFDTLSEVEGASRTTNEGIADAARRESEAEELLGKVSEAILKLQGTLQTRDVQKQLLDALDLGEFASVLTETAGVLPEDDNQIRDSVGRFKRSFSEVENSLKKALTALDDRFAKIYVIITKQDDKGGENAMKVKLKAMSRDSLMSTAQELTESASDRSAIISAELQAIEQDRSTLATELRIVFDGAVNVLKAAERVSRLPETMGAWAKQPFLQIRVPEISESELQVRLNDLLDDILCSEEIPDGEALAFRAIQHVTAREENLRVTILKPDVVLRAERVDVESMAYFSGGEGVTTAILLYCTLLQLRAQNKGRVQHAKDAGVLILDNPVGKCSRPDFLRLHRQIAQQMSVQLLYLTGINDVSAIGTFEHIVRLKNRHQNSKTGDFHVKIDDTSTMEAAKIVMQKS